MAESAPRPPLAPPTDFHHTEHSLDRPDPYHWLRNRTDPKVRAYIDAENDYTEAKTAHLAALRDTLAQEVIGRMKEDDVGTPVDYGPWVYVERTEAGKDYPVLCRNRAGSKRYEDILDRNALAEGHDYLKVGAYAPSPDHRYLAYCVDYDGRERYTIFIKDLVTGKTSQASLANTDTSLAWASDCHTLFYVTRDEITNTPDTLFRHTLGDAPEAGKRVLHEDDLRFTVEVLRSRSSEYIMLLCESRRTSEVWVLKADEPEGRFRCLAPRQHGMLYFAHHHTTRMGVGRFFILTDYAPDPKGEQTQAAYNFRLMKCPEGGSSTEDWEEVIPHSPDRHLKDVESFQDHLVLVGRQKGLPQIWILDLETMAERQVALRESSYGLWLEQNPDYHTRALTFGFSSLRQPRTIVREPLRGGPWDIVKVEEVLGGYDPGDYEVERLEVPTRDGTLVPLSMVYNRHRRTKPGPLILTGYGAYGISYDGVFRPRRISLLDRGVTFVIAHVRGGGELGRDWHFQGRLRSKTNTFTDFIDCAKFLIDEGYATSKSLVIRGGSAGGLLVGAVLNEAPELFAGAVADVPFVDVMSTMMDETLPLTAGEWEEWGDPREPGDYAYMRAYSPIDNIRALPYPPLFIYSGLNDNRVQYWEPTKWIATLRQVEGARGEALLYTNTGAGHGGASGRYGRIGEEALTMAFMLDVLGLA